MDGKRRRETDLFGLWFRQELSRPLTSDAPQHDSRFYLQYTEGAVFRGASWGPKGSPLIFALPTKKLGGFGPPNQTLSQDGRNPITNCVNQRLRTHQDGS